MQLALLDSKLLSVLPRPDFTNFRTWSYRCSCSNFTPVSLCMLKCSRARTLTCRYIYCSFNNAGLGVTMCCVFLIFFTILLYITLLYKYFCWVIFSLYLLYMYCYHLIFSFWFQSYLIITLLLSSLSSSSLLVIIFMPGSYNYVPGKTKVSRGYKFAAVVYQQFVQNAINYYYYYYCYPHHQQFSFLKACTLTN